MSEVDVSKNFGLCGIVRILYDLFTSLIKDMGEKTNNVVNWSDVDHSVLQKFPILRFGLQILHAYPVADRNFNIEVFHNRVIIQNIFQKWKSQ